MTSTSRAPRRSRSPPCTWAKSSMGPSSRCTTRGCRPASARGGRSRQRHAGDVPRAPVRQGRDVLVLPPGDLTRRARSHPRDRGGDRLGAGLPYRVVNVAAGDLGASATKKYDIEAWFPSQGRYREITSTSNTTDFQARRLDIRFRGDQGPRAVHTLNGTAATARALLSVLENFQDEGGSVTVPDALVQHGGPGRIKHEEAIRALIGASSERSWPPRGSRHGDTLRVARTLC